MSLLDYVAVIIGGAQGIGKIITEKLVEEGAKVVITDNDSEQGHALIKEINENFGENTSKFVECNVREATQISHLLNKAKSRYRRLDIVCIYGGEASDNMSDARDNLEINSTSIVLGTYKAIEIMSIKNGGIGGVVINVGSRGGSRTSQLTASYLASESKLVESFTRSFGIFPHSGDDNVRVNCIIPSKKEESAVSRSSWYRRHSAPDVLQQEVVVNSSTLVEAFMKCLDMEEMINGNVITFDPPDKIIRHHYERRKYQKISDEDADCKLL